ncbi:hypothetical protein J5J86_13930 [Aquabacter sp. L1I39]|uniref:hypothetical protein n=1 Tax=Aquabacter sp. L1I39 TaxID=2820278 RepID=UPI001ADAF949|nr:hypothetical protein [Aquabacter sp. L1I39]QTL01905.1 hypothetical protein J5J86_13930 [Aquabacter sp. L1I39]
MPIIAPAIAAVSGLVAAAGPIGSALIGVGASVGLSYLSKALSGSTSAASATTSGFEGSLQIAGDVPRGFAIGEVVTEGHLAYVNVSGGNNIHLDRVYVIGEGPHESLENIWVDGTLRTLALQSSTDDVDHYVVSDFNYPTTGIPTMHVWFVRGYSDQSALSALVDGSNPAGRWTSDFRGAGQCYAVVRTTFWKEIYDAIPSFHFHVKGRRFYDWRLDSTAGGSGSHRWGNERTWAYSANPIVSLYNYQRGLFVNGNLLVGQGVQPIDFVLDAYTSGANACDEAVLDSAGSSGDRFAIGTYVSASEEYGAVVQRCLDGCAGAMIERAGSFAPVVGVAQTTVMTVTDSDLIAGAPIRFARKTTRDKLVNGIFGTYSDLTQKGEAISYPARTDSAAEAEDTEQRRVQSDHPEVNDPVIAQRLAEIELRLARLQATASITLGMAAVVLEPGDWIRWNSARYGDRRWMILRITPGKNRTFQLDLREIAASAYGEADDAPVNAGSVGDRDPQVTAVGITLAAKTLPAPGGGQSPAIAVYWTPVEDPTVDAILLEYRQDGSTDVLTARADDPASGLFVISAGVQGTTGYQVRAIPTSTPPRAMTWSDWEDVTTDAQVMAAATQPPSWQTVMNIELPATVAAMEQNLADLNVRIAAATAQLALIQAEHGTKINAVAGEVRADTASQIEKATGPNSALVAQIDTTYATNRNGIAQVETQVLTVADDLDTLATFTTSLNTAVTGLASYVDANLTVRYTVAASVPDGATAAYELQLIADGNVAGQYLVVTSTGSYAAQRADKFLWLRADGTTPFAMFDTIDGVFYLKGDLLADGTIKANHIDVTSLSAISANFGTITAGTILSPTGVFTLNATDGYILVVSDP